MKAQKIISKKKLIYLMRKILKLYFKDITVQSTLKEAKNF